MLVSIATVREFTEGVTYEEFAADRMRIRAVLYEIGVLGEASRYVPDEVQQRYPEVPWAEIQGMRNVLIHEYFRMHLPTVWDTVTSDLPSLEGKLRRIAAQEGGD